MKRIIALVFCLWASSIFAATDLPVTIGGETYLVALTENTFLTSSVSAQPGQDVGEHYFGEIATVPDSWVRVSKINGQWQGLASLYSTLYVVDQPAAISGSNVQAASIASPAIAASEIDDIGGCGVAGHGQGQSASMLSEMESGVVAEALFSDFCSAQDQVNGVCILPEVEFVFDTAFQSVFGANHMAQAISLINTVSGFYQQDRNEVDDFNGMNMAIDATKMTFLTSEVFSATTNANGFLSDIRTKKANSQLSFIDNHNPLALLHVVTGRNFDGSTAGLAYVNAMCNSNGFGSATTSVSNGSIPLAAVIVAHEIGHNLGTFHDASVNNVDGDGIPNHDNSACPVNMDSAGPHIMSDNVGANLPGFSDCSVTSMVNAIEALGSLDQCFNYPADIAISNAVSPANVNVGDTFSASYMVSVNDEGDRPITQVRMTGTSNVGAQFTSVTANGNACSIGSNEDYANTRYTCTMNAVVGNSVTINIDGTITGWNAQAVTTHTATVLTANVTDFLTSDNEVIKAMAVAGTITAPPAPAGANSGGGGGGGGSLGWPLLLGLFGLFFRRSCS